MVKFKALFQFFKYLDIFSVPIDLNYNKKNRFRSYFGAFISLFVYAVAFYFLIKQYIGWKNIDFPTTISSSENYSVTNLLNENRSIEFILDHKNYGIYFVMWATLPDRTDLFYRDLQNYFTIEYKFSQTGLESDRVDLQFENCNQRKMKEYLNINYAEKDVPENETIPWSLCVKNPLKMGLLANLEKNVVYEPTLLLQIRNCQNSSINNNSCASKEDISKMKNYVIVQSSIPKTIYDFKNQSNSIRKLYKYNEYGLDLGLTKVIKTQINPTFLYKDWGLFSDDYQLDSINFNPGEQTLDFRTLNEKDNLLYEYQIVISYQIDKYYIRNQKLDDMIGSFGGIISVIYSIGSLLCIKINSIFFITSLINDTFRFKINAKKTKGKVLIKTKLFNTIDYENNFFSSMISIFKNWKIYKKSRKKVNKFIDIKKIIKKFQEVENIKLLLLNESQRYLFELIPKPEISEEISILRKKLSKQDIFKFKRRQIDIDEKLIDLLDPRTVKLLNFKKEAAEVSFEKKNIKEIKGLQMIETNK